MSLLCFRVQRLLLNCEGVDLPIKLEHHTTFEKSHNFGFRVRFASQLVKALQSLHYPHPLTYSQLLYPSPKEEDDILAFLSARALSSPSASITIPPPPEDPLLREYTLLKGQVEANALRITRVNAVLAALQKQERDLQWEKELQLKAKLLSTKEHGQANVEKLTSLVLASRERISNLVMEWEEHRGPLLEKYKENARQALVHRHAEHAYRKEMAEMKSELKDLLNRAKVDQTSAAAAATAVAAPSSSERALVIAKVLDSVKQVNKLDVEVKKIQHEVGEIGKDVEFYFEQLDAIERQCDELLFASGMDSVYALFVEIVEKFEDLLEVEHEIQRVHSSRNDKTSKINRLKESSLKPFPS